MTSNAIERVAHGVAMEPLIRFSVSRKELVGWMAVALENGFLAYVEPSRERPCGNCDTGMIVFSEAVNRVRKRMCNECGAVDCIADDDLGECGISEEGIAAFVASRICSSDHPEHNADYWYLGTTIVAKHQGGLFFSVAPSVEVCTSILNQKAALLNVLERPECVPDEYSDRVIVASEVVYVDEFGVSVRDDVLDCKSITSANAGSYNHGDEIAVRRCRLHDFVLDKVDKLRKQYIISKKDPGRISFADVAEEFGPTLPEGLSKNPATIRRDLEAVTGCTMNRKKILVPLPAAKRDDRSFDPVVYVALVKYDDPTYLGNYNPMWMELRKHIEKFTAPDEFDAVLKQLESNEKFRAFRENVVKAMDYGEAEMDRVICRYSPLLKKLIEEAFASVCGGEEQPERLKNAV